MFDARQALNQAEATYRPWAFVDLDGEVQHLPHPLMVDPGVVAMLAEVGKADDGDAMLEALAPQAAAAVARMPPAVQRQLLEAWQADIQLDDSGKERTPSSVTAPSAPPSKPTARPKASTSTRSNSGKSQASRARS